MKFKAILINIVIPFCQSTLYGAAIPSSQSKGGEFDRQEMYYRIVDYFDNNVTVHAFTCKHKASSSIKMNYPISDMIHSVVINCNNNIE